jgi:hypothetical protein
MQKNAIIALVIGLIIGGLVIFLVMGFTDVGSTMVINFKGEKSEPVAKLSEPQAITGTGGDEKISVQCESKTVTINPTWTKNNTEYSFTANLIGNKCADNFIVNTVKIVTMNTALADKDATETPVLRAAVDSAKTISLATWDSFFPSGPNDTSNFETEADRIKGSLGVTTISYPGGFTGLKSIQGPLSSSKDDCSITDAGWFSDGFKYAWDWCNDHHWVCLGILIIIF